ncbi:Uncharacterised protein [Vibrio cholerae]|nr:Uncharacterised protein [Vibrio cholerae]CSB80054.1 Uncharacterised protein [Vibrio cholerae]CSC85774.1 Uncharacterised protein [Vibrio cholerae]
MTAATIEPNTLAGMTDIGSCAAKGIAPSEIPTKPIAPAALPASSSEDSNSSSLRPIAVASAIPSGATGIAQAIAPIN